MKLLDNKIWSYLGKNYYCAQRNFTYKFLRGSENKSIPTWISTIKGAVDKSK